jgi:hypothetical protein
MMLEEEKHTNWGGGGKEIIGLQSFPALLQDLYELRQIDLQPCSRQEQDDYMVPACVSCGAWVTLKMPRIVC